MSFVLSSMTIDGKASPKRDVDYPSNSVGVELSLADLPVGARARVIAVRGSGAVARRLIEMGVVPGAPVRVIKLAPLGDPLEIRVRGYNLALRHTEAQMISVVISDK